jgi:hypothetical protein
MSRTITISCARFTATPAVGFDPATGQGTISVPYVAGEWIPEVTHPDGSITAAHMKEHPTATLAGFASIPLGPTDVAGDKLAELVGTVAAQEGLDLTAGDQVFTS